MYLHAQKFRLKKDYAQNENKHFNDKIYFNKMGLSIINLHNIIIHKKLTNEFMLTR